MALDFELNELIPALEELLLIRQACTEAQENAARGGILAAAWREEADRLAELLTFLETTPAPPVPPKLSAWAVRLSVRAGQLSDLDSHFAVDAVETDAPDAFPLLAKIPQIISLSGLYLHTGKLSLSSTDKDAICFSNT